ncbi:MAG: MBOAT family protein [Clostridia bacterium]|nr:MBOAT family protein [Clostridia bacterium]
MASIAASYVTGLLIEKYHGRTLSKLFLTVSVVFSLGLLGYFKYADFFIANFNALTGFPYPFLSLALPIGISFYTFQLISYSVDVYRGETSAQRNIINLGAYVALFPQLIAGPIVRYQDISRQLISRTHSFDKAWRGCRSFVIGLAKKVLIANTLGELCTAYLESSAPSVAYGWLYAVAYMLQVYFDFSGYSDMAIGLGRIFGFEFLPNFNYPFISSSITEFWRRWHISLGSWFRDYVYIPLGGNRVKKGRMLFNIFAVWFLTGFWHGAEWNFVIWGLYFGVLLTLEKFFFARFLSSHKILGRVYVLFFVIISFAIFAANGFSSAIANLGVMFGTLGQSLFSPEFAYALRNYGFVLILAIIGATPLCKRLWLGARDRAKQSALFDVAEVLVLAFLLIVVSAYLADGSFNPFLYFRF